MNPFEFFAWLAAFFGVFKVLWWLEGKWQLYKFRRWMRRRDV